MSKIKPYISCNKMVQLTQLTQIEKIFQDYSASIL